MSLNMSGLVVKTGGFEVADADRCVEGSINKTTPGSLASFVLADYLAQIHPGRKMASRSSGVHP